MECGWAGHWRLAVATLATATAFALPVKGYHGRRPEEVPTSFAPGHSVQTARYRAGWNSHWLEVRSPQGRLLTRWPIGALAAPADPQLPAQPVPVATRTRLRSVETDAGRQLQVRMEFDAPWPFSEQTETFLFLPGRIETRVRVRWRTQPTRLVRMVYGGSLAPGCTDLEGLWQMRDGAVWDAAPVPGVTTRTGSLEYRRRVVTRSTDPLRLVIGGVDEEDTAALDDAVFGQTSYRNSSTPWTTVRRYELEAGAGDHILSLKVSNAAGNGGIWRGPCVLGPTDALRTGGHGDGWRRAAATGTALHHWCPDRYSVPLKDRLTVSLTSVDRTRDAVPENVTTGGRFFLPAYAAAIEGDGGWWGLGTLDLPRAEDGLRIEWRDGALTCPFLLATEPGGRPGDWLNGPRLAILVAGGRAGVLQSYLSALPPRKAQPRQDWWSGPEYCTWGDQCYAAQAGGQDVGGLTNSNFGTWYGALRKAGIHAPTVLLDAGWWQLDKRVITQLHADGKRVVLWTQPHWLPDLTRRSDMAVRDAADRPLAYDKGNWLQDYTLKSVREYMAAAIRSYLSPGDWNADGLKLDFPYTPAPIWCRTADPSWGAGEQYRAHVLQWWYRTVKATRPDALLTLGCTNPLFGAVQDTCRLNEDWFGDPELFRRRAEVALAMGEWVNCDDWCAYETYLENQACERPVWGTLTLMSAQWRGDRSNNRVALTTEWSRRLAAISRLAAMAPVRTGQQVRYSRATGTCARVDQSGRMVAQALRLEGGAVASAFAIRRGDAVLVTATQSGDLDLRTDRPVIWATAIHADGLRSPASCIPTEGGCRLRVEDAAHGVQWVEVSLRKW